LKVKGVGGWGGGIPANTKHKKAPVTIYYQLDKVDFKTVLAEIKREI